jgi:hypothetical protein
MCGGCRVGVMPNPTRPRIASWSCLASVRDPRRQRMGTNLTTTGLPKLCLVVLLTDHNSDTNVQKALDYSTKYAGALLVLPAVEVTTAHGHALVYFSPDQADRVRDLLACIGTVGRPGSPNSHTRKSSGASPADRCVIARQTAAPAALCADPVRGHSTTRGAAATPGRAPALVTDC